MNATPIRSDVTISEGKQTLLDTVAGAYDRLSAHAEAEPICIVFCFVTEDGMVESGYHTTGEADKRNSLYVARGLTALQYDVNEWERLSSQ